MIKFPWTSEPREARADRLHRAANDAWGKRHHVKRHAPPPVDSSLPFVTEAQKEAIRHADEVFWAAEFRALNSLKGWLGLAG